MAGLGNQKGGSNYIYAKIAGGVISVKAEEGSAGATKRVVEQKGQPDIVLWENTFTDLSGYIKAVWIHESKEKRFKHQLCIMVDPGDNTSPIVLSCAYNSQYAKSFYNVFENIKFDSEVTLSPFAYTPKDRPDKTFYGISVYQFGSNKKLLPFLDIGSKEKPSETIPQPYKDRAGDWQWGDQDYWYREYITEAAKRLGLDKKERSDNYDAGSGPPPRQSGLSGGRAGMAPPSERAGTLMDIDDDEIPF